MLGSKIKQFRIENDYSQGDIAKILGVSIRTVSRWEQNKNKPNQNEIERLSKLIGISEDELINDEFISIDPLESVSNRGILEQISEGVDNIVTSNEALNETFSLTRVEGMKRHEELISKLRAQNEELLAKLNEESSKNNRLVSETNRLNARFQFFLIIVMCLILVILAFGMWLFWRNNVFSKEITEGTVITNEASYFDIDENN